MTQYRKKLIEVALPLEAINHGSRPETENPFLKGHPRAIHNWWARTPLSVSRAILFAQLIDDPGNDLTPEKARVKREELLEFVQKLSTWEATMDKELIEKAREMISVQFKGRIPEFWDMFGGRASIPLEAQRLGLKVTSSDLNPVAVTIQRALLEFPARFNGRPPVHPLESSTLVERTDWEGASGLAEDVRWYGSWVCQEALKRLAKYYPVGPDRKPVIGWLWARTVPSPDPSCNSVHVPLVRSFKLAGKKRQVWIAPKIDKRNNSITFTIVEGNNTEIGGTISRKGAACILSNSPMPFSYIREQAKKGNMDCSLMAIVGEGQRSRSYHAPTEAHISAAKCIRPSWRPDCDLPKKHRNFQPPVYGMDNLGDLFTPRQLLALDTICEIITGLRESILKQANGDAEYSNAVVFYLACALSRMTDYHSNLCTWNPTNENVSHIFQRQAIPMAWDFCEANPVQGKLAYDVAAQWVASSLESVPLGVAPARVLQLDARKAVPEFHVSPVISTDPPYYDNISYADLSDFFYVWLRRILRGVDPQTFATLLTPKDPELIASPTRHGSEQLAEKHFREGFQGVFKSIHEYANRTLPCTIYYAFKQEEDDEDEVGQGQRASTGWETMLEGLVDAGFQITGTWPVRTTKKARAVAQNANALASAVVLVARRREANSAIGTRKQLLGVLKAELPGALTSLTQSNVAPVDLAQAMIGPGMAVFTQFSRVVESDGRIMSVRTALGLVNQVLDEILTEQEGEFDADTRWALAWFEQFGLDDEDSGTADTLCRAKNTALNSLIEAGIVTSKRGKVRLLRRDELPVQWSPTADARLTVWGGTQHLIRTLETNGESQAAALLSRLGGIAGVARDLAYRLYSTCERKKRTQEAIAYNSLVVAWPELTKLARLAQIRQNSGQKELFN